MSASLQAQELEQQRRNTFRLQREAADPALSAWVSANAGTGKTHVLAMRVLRLLMAGTAPDRILCLTYTKAAAAEMSGRVLDRLGSWVTLENDELARELERLTGRPAEAAEIERARQLFAIAIETPGGLKVQTIHAFCERLLQRFPLEAGVPPHFAILDEESCRALQRQAIDEVLVEATRDKDGLLGRALHCAVRFAADDRFDELLRDAIGRRDWVEDAGRLEYGAADAFASAEAIYRATLSVRAEATLEALETAMCSVLSDAQIARARDVLASGLANDVKASANLARVPGARTREQRVEALAKVFLTDRCEPRKNLMTKNMASDYADVDQFLSAAQSSFVPLFTEYTHLRVIEATMALMQLAEAVLRRYGALKARRAALDFEDLIARSASLLVEGAGAEWVLYKLDGGLDHILVDEAQDTSPAQWRVVSALAEEFFSGAGAREDAVRTLFAVGDEKQSIYGFQGARPEMFARTGARFAAAAESAGRPWRNVPLTLSFRSVPPVLSAVDAVLSGGARWAATPAAQAVRHIADRLGHAGLVEIWDTAKSEDADLADAWTPLDETPPSSPVARLAHRIADTIAAWLANGEMLISEGRPVQPGDILILVRKREPFAGAMVAALKTRGIPVAGADRIQLTEQLAVQDLMAVGDFILLPEDDLVLATLLKSPFFGLNDDDLTTLAAKRRGSLWSALLAAAGTSPRLAPVADTLKRWRSRADYAPPFEFFATLLDADHGRRQLIGRLGPEAADAIDEFLSLALKYDEGAPPSLQGFLDWLRRNEIVIKRDMEQGRGEVRVMTVHGAKGLEAPIVFLPDTCTVRSGERPGGLLVLPHAARPAEMAEPFCWPVKGTAHADGVRFARDAARVRESEERNRLLYVALTRARDRLYVAGFEGVRGREEGCWYDLIADALDGSLAEGIDLLGNKVRRLESRQEAPPKPARAGPAVGPEALDPPDWARRPAPREPQLAVPLAPSRLAPLEIDEEGEPVEPARDGAARLAEPPVLAPAAMRKDQRLLRGTLTHALLQHLPDLDSSTWEAAAERFVRLRGAALPKRVRASVVAETLALIRHADFAALFGPTSRAEVPVVAEIDVPGGKGRTLRLTGQIDRLVHLGSEVLIVDFKTNRPPPWRAEDVAEAYLLQLAAYRLAVARIFPGIAVRAALLWTDGPRIMEIPAPLLDGAEARLFTLERANLDA